MHTFSNLFYSFIFLSMSLVSDVFASTRGVIGEDQENPAAARRGAAAAEVAEPCVIGVRKVAGEYRAQVKIPTGDAGGWVERWCGVCDGVSERFVHNNTAHTSSCEAKGLAFVEGLGERDGEVPFSWMTYRPDVPHDVVVTGYTSIPLASREFYGRCSPRFHHVTCYRRIDGTRYLVTKPTHVEESRVFGAPETILRYGGGKTRVTGVKGVKGFLKRVKNGARAETFRYNNREVHLWTEFDKYTVGDTPESTEVFYQKTDRKYGADGEMRYDQPQMAAFTPYWYTIIESKHDLPHPVDPEARDNLPPAMLAIPSSEGATASAAASSAAATA